MNWLIAHQQELIIGILASAIVAVAGYLLNLWFGSKRQPDGAALTVQGAKVSKSPVASGRGNVQRVNSPNTNIYHINSPTTTPTKPQAAEPKPVKTQAVKTPQRLSTGLTRTVPVLVTQEEEMYEHQKGTPAVLVRFNNEPNEAGQSEHLTAKARIIYFDANGAELCRLNDGCWLEERLNAKTFDYDESHELMLCAVNDGVLHAFTNKRVQENMYAEDDPGMDMVPVHGFTSGTVDVRLSNKYTGEVLNHSIYTLTIDPLKATLKTT